MCAALQRLAGNSPFYAVIGEMLRNTNLIIALSRLLFGHSRHSQAYYRPDPAAEDALIGAGVHGSILAATTGEYYARTADERVEMMSRVKGAIAASVPLIVGTEAMRT